MTGAVKADDHEIAVCQPSDVCLVEFRQQCGRAGLNFTGCLSVAKVIGVPGPR